MRFVAVKAVDQQAILAWHRMRAGWNEERTALINRVRGLLAEFGVWLPRSAQALIRALPRLIQDDSLPARLRALLTLAEEQLRLLDERIDQCAIEIREHAKQSEARAVSVRSPASVRSPPAPCSRPCPMHAISRTAARWLPGWDSRRGSTAPEARNASVSSPSAVIPISGGY